MSTEEFRVGDKVRHIDCPEAGVGVVVEVKASGRVKVDYQDTWYRECTDDAEMLRLVEPTGPVVTETVKRIKPGVYGIVEVTRVYPDGVNIIANPAKLNGEALRAAAATLTEIADALDGGAQ